MSDQPIIRRRTQKLNAISEERVNNQKTQSQYQPYKDAAWGFINHWYPALFSDELAEDAIQGLQICGVPIVLRRVDGKIYALKDQCVHRGVRFSEKKMCFNKKTISCWYHGFTFDLKDGSLTTIVGNPDDKLIGTTGAGKSTAIRELLERLNARPMRRLGVSRRELFDRWAALLFPAT